MQARLGSASGILLNHVYQVSSKDARSRVLWASPAPG